MKCFCLEDWNERELVEHGNDKLPFDRLKRFSPKAVSLYCYDNLAKDGPIVFCRQPR